MKYDIAVIGAGAAGFFAATRAAEHGCQVVLLEKNRKPGAKILMSGGTRCNLTQATDSRGIVEAFGRQGRFLHSALSSLGPDQVVDLFNAEGVATKVESTGKVFPASDRALDVLAALRRMLDRSGAKLLLDSAVSGISHENEMFQIETVQGTVTARKVILTVGGQSYPGCGTTGDGYAWAKQFGHKIIPTRPALVPLRSSADWVKSLSGVTLPDVLVRIHSTIHFDTKKKMIADRRTLSENSSGRKSVSNQSALGRAGKAIAERRGSFLFTHFGISGPVAMDVSRAVTGNPDSGAWQAVCDFVPTMTEQQIVEELQAATKADGKRPVRSVLAKWLPKRLTEALLAELLEYPLAEFSKANRQKLLDALKRTPIPITGSLGFKKAEVTAGGVALAEVDSKTMQSKLMNDLYFAGEVLDLDGPIGGYNFQSAFSTGALAGEAAAEEFV